MKVTAYSHINGEQSLTHTMSKARPKTAQTFTYKKLVQVLQGKYTSLNTQNFLEKSSFKNINIDDKKKVLQQGIIQQQKKTLQKSRNASIDWCHYNKQKLGGFHRRSQIKVKQNNKYSNQSKQNNKFTPYASIEHRIFKTERVTVIEKPKTKKTEKITQNPKKYVTKKQILSTPTKITQCQQNITLDQWKNQDQLSFSSLLNKNGPF